MFLMCWIESQKAMRLVGFLHERQFALRLSKLLFFEENPPRRNIIRFVDQPANIRGLGFEPLPLFLYIIFISASALKRTFNETVWLWAVND